MRALIFAVAGAWLVSGCGPMDDDSLDPGAPPAGTVEQVLVVAEPPVPPRESGQTLEVIELVAVEPPGQGAIDARLSTKPTEDQFFYKVQLRTVAKQCPVPFPVPAH